MWLVKKGTFTFQEPYLRNDRIGWAQAASTRSTVRKRRYTPALCASAASCRSRRSSGSAFNQRARRGRHVTVRRAHPRWRIRPSAWVSWAPKAWAKRGSMPLDSPSMIEYLVRHGFMERVGPVTGKWCLNWTNKEVQTGQEEMQFVRGEERNRGKTRNHSFKHRE